MLTLWLRPRNFGLSSDSTWTVGRGPRSIRGCATDDRRSEEHTSELQSRLHLVCRLLLEKKKQAHTIRHRRSMYLQHGNRETPSLIEHRIATTNVQPGPPSTLAHLQVLTRHKVLRLLHV